MNKIKKIAIISTGQNFIWTSMQEIFPAIEKCWEMAMDELKIEYKIINVDTVPLRQYAKCILQCDIIIILAFNERISRLMVELRRSLNSSASFIFHLHGLATIGLWPLSRFGVLELMNSGDVFIGTCPGDIKCMKLISNNACTFEVPFPYFPLETTVQVNNLVFAYIGRISDQKNIDILIKAYHLLKRRIKTVPHLVIYGEEDHLGSPNMGLLSSSCLQGLKHLVASLNLENDVFFKGFMERELIYSELGPEHIFVSASTHSDENFGMALLRSIAMGGSAVVSHWGGHQLFGQYCPDRVRTVTVEIENFFPRPNLANFSFSMESAFNNHLIKKNNYRLPEYFSVGNVVNNFKKIFQEKNEKKERLLISENTEKLFFQQKEFEAKGYKQRVFHSYSDPLAQLFLKAYL